MKIQNFYLPLIIILAVLFLWQWQCRKPKESDPVIKEVVKTEWKTVKGDTVYVPVPEVVRVPGPERIKEVLRTVYVKDPTTGRVDTVRISRDTSTAKDYYVQREYIDTTRTPYGPIITNNIVSENKLQLSQTLFDLKVPETTISRTEVKRTGALFGGVRVMGNETEFLKGYNLNLAYKTKGDKIFEVGAWKLQGIDRIQYEAGVKFKLFGK